MITVKCDLGQHPVLSALGINLDLRMLQEVAGIEEKGVYVSVSVSMSLCVSGGSNIRQGRKTK